MTVPIADVPPPVLRHPLGLPRGTVRATLSVMIVGLFWVLLLMPEAHKVTVPPYLYFLLALVLAFFGAHGHSIAPAGTAEPHPWHLPRGTFRWLMVIGTLAVIGWEYYSNPELLLVRLTPDPTVLPPEWPFLLMSLFGGFALGWVVRLGPWHRSYWFQDIEAWISLLAMICLGAEIFIRLFINPNLQEPLNLFVWECILVTIVSFYFGVRCA